MTAALGAATGSFILFHYLVKITLKVEDKKQSRKQTDTGSDAFSVETEYLPPLPDPVVSILRLVSTIMPRWLCLPSVFDLIM